MASLFKTIFLAASFSLLAGCAPKLANSDVDHVRNEFIVKMKGFIVGDVEAKIVLLREIQTGDINIAIELLEYSIDMYAIQLNGYINRSSGAEQQKYRDAIVGIKEYRLAFPRKAQDFPALAEYSEEITTARNKALEILSSYN